jgi:hypothetical protein
VKGQKATLQEYDYFRQTNSNQKEARNTAVPVALVVGIGAGIALCVLVWWLTRRRGPEMSVALQEQISSIVGGHPAAVQEWGGPSVLGQPELVAEVLRIEERNARGRER